MSKLTAKQKAFCQEYIVDLNATQSAIRAKYSTKTAKQIATENLSKPVIQSEIQRLQDDRAKRTEIRADYVIAKIKAIVDDPEARNSDKLKGAELLCRHLGLFKDKLEVSTRLKGYDDYKTPEELQERQRRALAGLDIIVRKRQLQLSGLRTANIDDDDKDIVKDGSNERQANEQTANSKIIVDGYKATD